MDENPFSRVPDCRSSAHARHSGRVAIQYQCRRGRFDGVFTFEERGPHLRESSPARCRGRDSRRRAGTALGSHATPAHPGAGFHQTRGRRCPLLDPAIIDDRNPDGDQPARSEDRVQAMPCRASPAFLTGEPGMANGGAPRMAHPRPLSPPGAARTPECPGSQWPVPPARFRPWAGPRARVRERRNPPLRCRCRYAACGPGAAA